MLVVHTQEENIEIISKYLGDDQLTNARYELASVLHVLINATANEFTLIESLAEELINTCNPSVDPRLWEKILKLPNSVFSIDRPLDIRIKQVIAMLSYTRIKRTKNESGLIELAKFFDYEIEIQHLEAHAYLPSRFPILLTSSPEESHFIMRIVFKKYKGQPCNKPSNKFPLTLPFTYSSQVDNDLIGLFNAIKPSYIHLIISYANEELSLGGQI